mgnify:FL=1|jgi:hypothetical protein
MTINQFLSKNVLKKRYISELTIQNAQTLA